MDHHPQPPPPTPTPFLTPPPPAMQAVCAKCSRLMCRAVVLFLVAECAQTTPMIAPLPGDPNFSIDGSVAFFKSGESNPTQPNPPPPVSNFPPPVSPPISDLSHCHHTLEV